MSDDERTFTWSRTPALVYVQADHERPVAELFDAMMARHDVHLHRQAIARDGARRDALGYETNADDRVGCVAVDDAFTRYGRTDPPAAADLDADLDNDEGTQP